MSIKSGDFSILAKEYIHRTGYSQSVLKALYRYAQLNPSEAITADVGAGTGKLTKDLIDLGFKGFAIEPNDFMREEGMRLTGRFPFQWSRGKAEQTGLATASVDWVFMGSSFHWTNAPIAICEFHRILKHKGFFVALWNPRNLEMCPLQKEIDDWIQSQVPNMKRVSSGSSRNIQNIEKTLIKGGYFQDVVLMEQAYTVPMTVERYLGAWQSVNDIRSQAGEEKFQQILQRIADTLRPYAVLNMPYRTRAWIAQKVN